MDEFQSIARLFRPLTLGAPEALDLLDDAAVIPSRPGFDLVITKDAMVEGVHFLPDDAPSLVAKKLLRVNLSDLAAKAAEPYAYFLAVAWPPGWGDAAREAFAAGLGEDQARFGLKLLGGDTVSTPGPLTLSLTMLGWVPSGQMVKRSGAEPGDVLLVSGTIGDGHLGLSAARGSWEGPDEDAAYLAARYRIPEPRTDLRAALAHYGTAAADISDGLLADAGHVATASGLGLEIDLDQIPLSTAASGWAARQPDREAAAVRLASGGDDYEIVCAARPCDAPAMMAMALAAGTSLTAIGRFTAEPGAKISYQGEKIVVGKGGWTHP